MPGTGLARGRCRALAVAVALVTGLLVALTVSETSSAASSTPSVITGGQTLTSGQELLSGDGHFALQMQSDGNLVESEPSGGRALWDSGTSGNPGADAVLEPTGELVVQTSSGTLAWSDNATTSGCPALNLQNDGNLVVYGPSTSVWADNMVVQTMQNGDLLEPNQVLISPSHNFELVMQSDGNLVVEDNEGNALWETYTNTYPGAYATLGSDGDLAVISNGTEVWNLGSAGQPGDHLDMQDDGNLVLYPAGDNSSTGGALWSSDTAGAAVESGNLFQTPQYGSASACPSPASVSAPATPPTTTTVITVGSPTPTTTTPTSSPTHKPSKLPDIGLKVLYGWTWTGASSYLRAISFHRVPRGVIWTATVTTPAPKTTHSKTKRRAAVRVMRAPTAARRRTLVHWLEHRRYHAGQKVRISLTQARHAAQVATFTVRFHHVPSVALSGVATHRSTTHKSTTHKSTTHK
jgi:hypothetical protein